MDNIIEKLFISIGLDARELEKGLGDTLEKTRAQVNGIAGNAISPALDAMTKSGIKVGNIDTKPLNDVRKSAEEAASATGKMAAGVTKDVAGVVKATSAGVSQAAAGMQTAAARAAAAIKSQLAALATGVIAPAFAALASGAIVNQFVEETGAINELSKTANVSVESLGAWKNALIETGADATKTGEIFRTLNQGMMDADQRGRGILAQYVKNGLLPDFRAANGEMQTTEEYLLNIADVIKDMDVRTATGILKNVAGITDTDTVEFLQQGRAAVTEYLAAAKELGVITREDVKLGKDYDASVKALAHSFKMLLLPVFRAITPVITGISNGVRFLTKHLLVFAPAAAAAGIAIAVSLIPQIKAAALAFAALGKAALANPLTWIIAALIAVGLALEDFAVWVQGGKSAFGEFYESVFGDAEGVRQTLDEMAETCKAAFAVIKDAARAVFPVIKDVIGAAFTNIKNIVTSSFAVWKSLYETVAATVNLVLAVYNALADGTEEAWAQVDSALLKIKDSFFGVFGAVGEFLGNWWNFAKTIFDGIKSGLEFAGRFSRLAGAGNVTLAAPATQTANSGGTRNSSVDAKTTVNVYGTATKEDYERAQETANGINSNIVAQAAEAYGMD